MRAPPPLPLPRVPPTPPLPGAAAARSSSILSLSSLLSAITHLFPGPAPAVLTLGKSVLCRPVPLCLRWLLAVLPCALRPAFLLLPLQPCQAAPSVSPPGQPEAPPLPPCPPTPSSCSAVQGAEGAVQQGASCLPSIPLTPHTPGCAARAGPRTFPPTRARCSSCTTRFWPRACFGWQSDSSPAFGTKCAARKEPGGSPVAKEPLGLGCLGSVAGAGG